MFRTDLSTRAHSLRLSLLASLGLVPIACGGSAVTVGPTGETGGSFGYGGGVSYGGDAVTVAGTASYGGDTVSYGGDVAIGGSTPNAAGAGPRSIPECNAPMVDPVTQLVTCSNGFKHRSTPTICSLPPGVGGATGTAGASGAAGQGGATTTFPSQPGCTVDADCSSLTLGFCYHPGDVASACLSGCLQDSDCGEQQVCLCDGSAHGGQCIHATCQTDAQCGAGSLCASAAAPCVGTAFGCFAAQDECFSNADCVDVGAGQGTCELAGQYRTCFFGSCGRPFLVAAAPRLAGVTRSSAWLAEASLTPPDLHGLCAAERVRMAEHWTRLAQMEHASIAAFARFNLQLLSLGAPAELVEACTRALADETAHARLCFGMASHYGAGPLGPTRLDISQCLETTNLTEIMKLVLNEGCLGETCAALEALEAAAVATDSAVKRAFSQIAQDEQRHAELAFQFLRWALAQAPASARAEVAREAASKVAELERAASRADEQPGLADRDLSAHGLLSGAALGAIRRQAARTVVAPLLASLLQVHSWPSAAGASTADALTA